MRRLAPRSGAWPYADFPDTAEIESRAYGRARWHADKPGVLCQYRESCPVHSRHLYVMDDGFWEIDHIDDFNPDMGHEFEHVAIDTAEGKMVLFSVAMALLAALLATWEG